MEITIKPISEITPYEKNPRNNDRAVEYVRNSLREFGWKQPIVIDTDGIIIAGHTRYKAAKSLGMTEVPCIIADDLTEEQVKAYRLADNKTAEYAEWNLDLLDEEIADIFAIDMQVFGFDPEKLKEETTRTQQLDEGGELDLEDFADDKFEHKCPRCGFTFNEK